MFKYNRKKKFVDRGGRFITEGEYKGAFAMNIKECDVGNNKALIFLPNKETIMLPSDKVKELFETGHFEYVKTIPKKVYAVCVAEYKEVTK